MSGLDIMIEHRRVHGSGLSQERVVPTRTGVQGSRTMVATRTVQYFGQDKSGRFGMTLDATTHSGLFAKKVPQFNALLMKHVQCPERCAVPLPSCLNVHPFPYADIS